MDSVGGSLAKLEGRFDLAHLVLHLHVRMLRLVVFLQVSALAKPFQADVALEGLLAIVFAEVVEQVAALRKGVLAAIDEAEES